MNARKRGERKEDSNGRKGFLHGQVVQCTLMSRMGTQIQLEPCPDGEGSVMPTFTPAQFERAISTRATASNIERRQKSLHVRIISQPIVQ